RARSSCCARRAPWSPTASPSCRSWSPAPWTAPEPEPERRRSGTVLPPEIDARIDEWVARTRELTGKEVREREPWNTEASADAIRHFAYGTDDDNPLWRDPDYAAGTSHGTILAPPAFLVSVLYPILHGAPMQAPLASLIGGVEYQWNERIRLGDRLRATSVQKDFYEKKSGTGRRLDFVISGVTYWNQNEQVVAKATGT